jgi:hypothetical protein
MVFDFAVASFLALKKHYAPGLRLHWGGMRRSASILLILLFGWMLSAPLFFTDAEASLPACCRRAGQHHCLMSTGLDSGYSSHGAHIGARCPMYPRTAAAVHPASWGEPPAQSVTAGIYEHPTALPQTEARYRTSWIRSRQKRGPPSFLLSL